MKPYTNDRKNHSLQAIYMSRHSIFLKSSHMYLGLLSTRLKSGHGYRYCHLSSTREMGRHFLTLLKSIYYIPYQMHVIFVFS